MTRGGKGRAEGAGKNLRLPSLLTHSAASQRVEFSTPGGPPLSFLQNLHPSLPLFSCVLPFLLPIPLLRGGGPLVGERKWAFGMESAEVLGEVRNPGHPSCRRNIGTQSPHSLLCPTPAPCQAQRGPALLHCILLVPQPSLGGIGAEAPGGAQRSLTRGGGDGGLHLRAVMPMGPPGCRTGPLD